MQAAYARLGPRADPVGLETRDVSAEGLESVAKAAKHSTRYRAWMTQVGIGDRCSWLFGDGLWWETPI
jgi:hypothetical protein